MRQRDDGVPALLQLLASEDGLSLPRAAKRLGLQTSALQRLLTALGDDPQCDGLGLVEQRADGRRTRLWLTARGRALVASTAAAHDAGVRTFGAQRLAAATAHPPRQASQPIDEAVIDEAPIALRYNGAAYAVMLATPTDLADFALGFSLTEGVIADATELRGIDIERRADGVVIEMAIPQARFEQIDERRRAFGGYSGCGLCGSESLQAAMRPTPVVTDSQRVDVAAVQAALRALPARQPLNALTGGVHAAAYVSADSLLVREDVGRHNALDKLIGALPRSPRPAGFLLMSSRASYEIVHKAACANIGLVVAISAPTALAIRTAEAAGITLLAFARDEGMNLYTHPWRVGDTR